MCVLGVYLIDSIIVCLRKRERERQNDRQTERQQRKDRLDMATHLIITAFGSRRRKIWFKVSIGYTVKMKLASTP